MTRKVEVTVFETVNGILSVKLYTLTEGSTQAAILNILKEALRSEEATR